MNQEFDGGFKTFHNLTMKKKFSFLAQWTFPILLLFRSFWCNPFSWISFLLIQNCRDQFYQLCLDNDSSVLLPLRLPFISSLQLRDSKQIECKFEPCHRAFLIEMDGPFFLWSALWLLLGMHYYLNVSVVLHTFFES